MEPRQRKSKSDELTPADKKKAKAESKLARAKSDKEIEFDPTTFNPFDVDLHRKEH